MILGHYGIAFAAKRVAPRSSLGTLTFAAQFLDEIWPILLPMGLEKVRIVPGLMAANIAPPPTDEHALAVTTLGLWLFVPWSWWIDRHRERRAPSER
ncbi:MAG TPA: hypothetical protein VFR95_01360 [Gemmatimonadaceae bacterium]|nr:hypothetical protein [Gemmatimonadaceae bacterium]